MTKSLTFSSLAFILFLFGGCRSKDPLVLHRPGEMDVWKTSPVEQTITQASDRPQVLVQTNYGEIVIELFDEESPISTANFLSYVDSGFYDGTVFHRVIPGFMIQGGGYTEDLELKPTDDPIPNEAGNDLRNSRGTVAMARTDEMDSGTAQFFVNLANNRFLNGDGETGGYAVFGRVLEGMGVVDQIARVETESLDELQDVPVEAVMIEQIRRLQ